MEEFDAADNVTVIVAHDSSLKSDGLGLEWFPHGTMKQWKKNGCAEKARWGSLSDLTKAAEGTNDKPRAPDIGIAGVMNCR